MTWRRMMGPHVDLVDQIKHVDLVDQINQFVGEAFRNLDEVVMGLAVRPYNEVDRAADRLVEKIPCTCEFHRV